VEMADPSSRFSAAWLTLDHCGSSLGRRWSGASWSKLEARMDHESGDTARLPIACTLTPADLAAMRGGLLPGLLAGASARESIPGGFRWRFEHATNLITQAAAVIEAEHRCCRFLRFLLIVEPGDGPVWLEVTGPEGTDAFLSTLLDMTSAKPDGR